ncbi:ATP-dependent RNA helicase DDX51 [Homo sapiens]|uniref:ATP-dependent RNA helicase DDX51 n=2 Tax=Homininae TaxID=207598 RepID=DDX51_HUMAN|nr:ATP-dependent RNA helicase DDX51 [Homo sapiens]Q8N8A6.3 RecName: Full=ATP-dependent RNA helicase DDX51; AltName: Full=DEAD box protein 51 [Homo sapiens]KAI2568755.1 DEAD-box helicase 51 [Homo sapiens]|eukprot:NP_778236.2 ATP-dependent RNA helicase DDX51 [Homo sapiens]
MALFYVARYPGPDAAAAAGPEGAEAGAHGRARALLERLQSRARERQQQREPAQTEAAASTEPATRRRRRPRRRRRVNDAEPGSPEAPQGKRRKADGEDAGAESNEEAPGEPSAGSSEEAPGEPSAGSSEEAPGERSTSASAEAAPDGPALEEAAGPLVPGLVLGGFGKRKAPKVQPFLPRWLAEPNCVRRNVTEDLVPIEDIPDVHPDLQKQLRAHGISSYFPVQAAVIPALLESAACGFLVGRGGYRPSDLCVSAPTGSGKTLAFVIPVVQALLSRVVCHIRALVVLPTKELAQQVSKVFNIYTDATPLRVSLVTGQKSLAKEQESLVQKTADGYRCLADIVVATPGRLVDHIDQTPGFSLQQLRFLIIDEADRMIDSMHQSWLPRVVAAAFQSEDPADPCALLQRRQAQAVTAASTCCPQMPLQKLLFSATLTQNPEKLQQLGLHQPRLFSTGLAHRGLEDTDGDGDSGKYAFPVGLTHHYVPCSLSSKPLVVLHLVLEMGFSRVLCFTNSRENSHRLFLLVQAFGGVDVAEFSSRYGPGQRRMILKQFEQGKIQLLISTDATARGIDVQGVELVVNYDAPQYLRTYVHRVGRTARAGKTGQAFTLLLKVQERRFLRMLTEAGAPELQRHELSSKLLQPLVPRYEEALSQLEESVKEERKQRAA